MALPRLALLGPFARAAFTLSGGAAAAQGLLLLSSPLLTRLYPPEVLGVFAVYASILAIVGVLVGLRYETAIPLPEQDDDAANLVAIVLGTTVALAVATAGVTFALEKSIAPSGATLPFSVLLPIGVLATGSYQAMYHWSLRKKRYSSIATTRIRQSIFSVAIQLAAHPLGALGLITGQIVAQGVGVITLAGGLKNYLGRIRWGAIKKVAYQHRRFPIFSTWSALLNAGGAQLPALVLAAVFGSAAAGMYALSYRVLAMPMTLVGSAVGNVFLSHAADAQRDGSLASLAAGVNLRLAQVGMPAALAIMLVAPEGFSIVFGSDWRQAGEMAVWMMPWLYMVFATSPISTLFDVLGNQQNNLLFQAVLMFARFVAIFVGALSNDLYLTIALFSLSSAACWVWLLLWITSHAGIPLKKTIEAQIGAFGWAVLCASPLLLWRSGLPVNFYLAFSLCAIATALRYAFILKSAGVQK